MPLAGQVFGEEGVSRDKRHAGAVADADVNAACERNDPAPPRGAMKIQDVRRKIFLEQSTAGAMSDVKKVSRIAGVELREMRPATAPV
jgi:hypothetical protein